MALPLVIGLGVLVMGGVAAYQIHESGRQADQMTQMQRETNEKELETMKPYMEAMQKQQADVGKYLERFQGQQAEMNRNMQEFMRTMQTQGGGVNQFIQGAGGGPDLSNMPPMPRYPLNYSNQ